MGGSVGPGGGTSALVFHADEEDLARVAHSLGEVVGLGLRNLAHCPVELNLMPESTRKWRAFNEKKPFLVGTVFTVVAVVGVAVGVPLLVVGSRKKEAPASAVLALAPMPAGGGLSATGTFW